MLLWVLLPWPATCAALLCREMEELTFFDSGPKPDWSKERSPGYGRLDFLRPGELLLAAVKAQVLQAVFIEKHIPDTSACALHRPWALAVGCLSHCPVSLLSTALQGCISLDAAAVCLLPYVLRFFCFICRWWVWCPHSQQACG